MFNNKFNSTKKDPLVEAVQIAMQDGEIRRQAEALVNEEFGVFNRRAVVREDLAAYDARLEEAYKCMKEGEKKDEKKEDKPKADYSKMREKMVGKGKDLETTRKIVGEAKKLADKDYDKDGKIESPKDEVWGSRFRAAKMAGKMEEEQIDEISKDLATRYFKKATKDARYAPQDKAVKRFAGAELAFKKKWGGAKVAATEETQIDEISKKLAVKTYLGRSKQNADDWHGLGGDDSLERKVQGSHKRIEKKFGKKTAEKARNIATSYYEEETQLDEISKKLALKAMKKSDERGEEEYDRDMTDDRLSDPKTHWDRAKRLRGHMKRKFGNKTIKTGGTDNLSPKSYEQGGGERRRADKLKKGPRAGMISARHRDKLKDNIKYSLGKHKKPNLPEETQMDEAAYSAKAARAGKDIGKPGKSFSKIAKSAAARYGSEERGKKVAGSILARIRAKHMKEDSSFNTAQATGKSVNEAPIAMPPAVQQPAPAVRGPAARLQGTKFYRGVNASTSGRGSARFVSPQTARVAPPPPKTGSSVVTSGNRMPTAGGSTSASRSLTTGASRSVTATPKATASGGSGFTYSRLGDREIGAAAGGARGLARSVARVASRVAGPAAVAADVVTPSGKTEPGNPVFRKTDTGKTSVAGYRSSTTPRAGTTDTNTTSRMVGDMSRRSGMAPSVRNQEVPKSISPVTTKEPGTLSAPAQKAAEPAAAKPTFSQAFAAARKEAKGSRGQFEFGGKKFQTNLAPAKGTEKFIAPTKQTATSVKVTNPTTPKSVSAPLPPSRPSDLGTTSATASAGGATTAARSTPKAEPGGQGPAASPTPATPKDTAQAAPQAAPTVTAKSDKPEVSSALKDKISPENLGSNPANLVNKDVTKGREPKPMNESVVNVGGNKYRIV